ncbi:hypothetical protein Ddye_021112 [Dipteronia dyeriana]|uniref:Uncharacterized protein n=1 Tax=Dipteronia dyeriana TaxID=168575 RepID=A0AAD9WXF2_9ROSI|nr:hypothetical protein Ddye_021112 [Dipteronia dyeriana]
MPLKWITNYEKAFQNTTPVIATDKKFTKLTDGSIQTTYEPISTPAIEASPSALSPSTPPVFHVPMIRPVTSEKEIPIHCFEPDGTPVYTDKINDHFKWDVDPKMCDADYECRACSKPMRSSYKPTRFYLDPKDPNSPWNGLLPKKYKPLSIYDKALQILKAEGLLPDEPEEPKGILPHISALIPCFMASSYDKGFPLMESSSIP